MLLARRELSTRQLRERLTRRKFEPGDIDAAIDRLTRERTVDDRRVATASAHIEAAIKGRGRRRVLQSVQRLGISAEVAKSAVDAVFAEVDEGTLLDHAIDKRLKGVSPRRLDDKARARVIRHLIAQGFDPSQVFARLRRKGVDGDE
jgi:regulatory protein